MSSPSEKSFGGEIGKAAKENLHVKDVVEFERMETNLDDIENEFWRIYLRSEATLSIHQGCKCR